MSNDLYLSRPTSQMATSRQAMERLGQSAQPYALSGSWIFLAGVWATFVFTLVRYLLPPLFGVPEMDLVTWLGTMFVPQNRASAFWLGMAWHFANGVILVLLYAMVLTAMRKQSTWLTGVSFGALSWLVGPMLSLPVMLTLHPLVPDEMENPGYFLLELGHGFKPAALELAAHLVYGVMAGILYKHRLCGAPVRTT